MSQEQLRPWLIRWLYTAALAHVAVGLALPWIVHTDLGISYLQQIEQHFWPQTAPVAARQIQAWWLSLFGPTVQTVGIWMAALSYFGDKHRSRAAWLWLLAGILTWAPQDMWISMQANMRINVWIDCAALLSLVPPLLCLWRIDATTIKGKI
ncbi:cell division protein [Undibacterium sp. TS12]|uniref:cell division protein n=1 Tax=Undibacterium sp. TS12 TaxID=2908202 RepID=UPI001F4CBF33|nr:cell division protein [Undibacterium sp. TS12]MCH8620872.1 cell division protein [Undibacterium sp. TS12]